ncbi:MAG: hypothetical protein ACRCUT_04735, partial [Spirochaetota bacterium]
RGELGQAGLLKKEIAEFSLQEIKTFDMLYQFYYSYSSSFKQKKLIDYLVLSVSRPVLSRESKNRISKIVLSSDVTNRRDFEKALFDEGYDRADLFEVFRDYDEDTLINELNDYLRRTGV